MTLSNQIRGLAIAALLMTSSPAYLVAQSWETVDAFQLPGLDWCQALNLAVDSSGRAFVAGRGFASGASRGSVAVRRSNDQGLTWQTVFTLEEQSHSIFSKFKVFSGAPGKMFITTGLLVYGSDDGGDSWTNVDDFVLAPGLPTYVGPEALATTRHGLFAIGAGWNVWRSTDNGATWSTVDTFQLGSSTAARGIAADASGNPFVVGDARV